MNKYGQASIKAVKLITAQNCLAPEEAWKIATIEVFGIGTTSQMKGCPKNTFLALCETGKVKGIRAGSFFNYLQENGYENEIYFDEDNKRYLKILEVYNMSLPIEYFKERIINLTYLVKGFKDYWRGKHNSKNEDFD